MKTERFEMVLSNAEKAALTEMARRNGVSAGQWVRTKIRETARRQDLWAEVSKKADGT